LFVAIDTNVLVYAEGLGEARKVERATKFTQALDPDQGAIPVQALAELYWVLVRKARLGRTEARTRVMRWEDTFTSVPSTQSALATAMDLSVDHGLQIFDGLILAAAANAGCRMLVSEDMQSGMVVLGLTIANPFADPPDELLRSFISPVS
jgi:predicted nucleic acid-binding protein